MSARESGRAFAGRDSDNTAPKFTRMTDEELESLREAERERKRAEREKGSFFFRVIIMDVILTVCFRNARRCRSSSAQKCQKEVQSG
jgi:hypothetical protein